MSTLVQNKKAYFNYEILEKLEAGIELLGFEVKALKSGQGSLEGAYVSIRGGEAYLLSSNVPPYQAGNTKPEYDPRRARRLLLTKKEIVKIAQIESQKGLTIVPISIYIKKGKLKLEVGIARGKKKHDKRELMKKRVSQREADRFLKSN